MLNILVIISVLLLVVLLLSLYIKMKKGKEEKPPRYVCPHCGDKDCDCHVQPED